MLLLPSSLPRFCFKYHPLTLKCKWTKIVVPIDIFDNKTRLLKQKFHLTTLEQVEPRSDDRAVKRTALHVLIVKMGQLEQVPCCRGGRADHVGEEGTIVASPCALVQELAAQVLHVAGIAIADIDDECPAGVEMRTHCRKGLLLYPARSEMCE